MKVPIPCLVAILIFPGALLGQIRDQTVVRSADGKKFFRFDLETLRPIPDADTKDALLTQNRSKGIQKDVIILSPAQEAQYAIGTIYPRFKVLSTVVGEYGRHPRRAVVHLPENWKFYDTCTIPYPYSIKKYSGFSAVVDLDRHPRTGRVYSVTFRVRYGGGHCYVLIAPENATTQDS